MEEEVERLGPSFKAFPAPFVPCGLSNVLLCVPLCLLLMGNTLRSKCPKGQP